MRQPRARIRGRFAGWLAAFCLVACSGAPSDTKRSAAKPTTPAPRSQERSPPVAGRFEANGPRAPDGVRYRRLERFEGTLVLALEQTDFIPRHEAGPPMNLVAADPAIEGCLAGPKHRRIAVLFLGRRSVAEDGNFGHLGMHSRQVRVERFLRGNPCR